MAVSIKQLAVGDEMSVQHFRLEPGSVVPEHSHHHEQLGYVVSGEAVFIADGEETVVGPGDSYALASNEPHRVENRGDDPVFGIDIFSPPRANPDWQD
jgi:quercetin dioxygenase-like cupin family protein